MPLSWRKGEKGVRISARSICAVEILEERRLLAATSVTFTDTDGDVVTAAVTGGGTVEVKPGSRFVWVTGSNVRSILSITVARSARGDGLATIGEIRSFGPLQELYAPAITVTKELTINDNLGYVDPANKVNIKVGVLKDLAVWTGGQAVHLMRLADWTSYSLGQQLNVPSIDRLVITGRADIPGTAANEALSGNCDAVLNLGVDNDGVNIAKAGEWLAGSIQVAGRMTDIATVGRVGTITAGRISGQLQASAFEPLTARRISGSITATGVPGVLTSIGTVSVTGSITTLSIVAQQGSIGEILVAGKAVGLTVISANQIDGIDVGGELDASRIQSFHGIGRIRAAAIGGVDVEVGVTPAFQGRATTRSSFADTTAQLGKLVITGSTAYPASYELVSGRNTIAAPRIGRLLLRNMESNAALQIYVLDRNSPGIVRKVDAIVPANSFYWTAGSPSPDALRSMLHVL